MSRCLQMWHLKFFFCKTGAGKILTHESDFHQVLSELQCCPEMSIKGCADPRPFS